METFTVGRVLIGAFIFWVTACVTAPRAINPYFEMPPDHLLQYERSLFALALQQQKSNKQENSIDLWKRFLKNNKWIFEIYFNEKPDKIITDRIFCALNNIKNFS